MQVCQTFKRLSTKVWDDLAKAKLHGRKLGEESITDYIMQDIFSLPKTKIITKEFTKPQEGVEGADWEWWFKGLDGTWFGMRVQAKVIDSNTDKYEHLHYPNKTPYQCDKLINRARLVNALPVYCLYTFSQTFNSNNAWRCSDFPKDTTKYGCSLTTAYEVKTLQRGYKNSLGELTPYMRPWHCVVCCKIDEYDSLSQRVRRYWEKALLKGPQISRDTIETSYELFLETENIYLPELTNEPPPYVIGVMEEQDAEGKIDDPDLGYVTVFIESEDDNVSKI